MQKYVLDTNVLLQNFQSLFAFDTEETIIPLVVLEELDKHKKHEKLGHNARQVARYLDKLSKRGDVTQGVELNNGGILKVVSVSDYTLEALELDVSNDNKIIATAQGYIQMNSSIDSSIVAPSVFRALNTLDKSKISSAEK
jgi:PhoH-like ATPase